MKVLNHPGDLEFKQVGQLDSPTISEPKTPLGGEVKGSREQVQLTSSKEKHSEKHVHWAWVYQIVTRNQSTIFICEHFQSRSQNLRQKIHTIFRGAPLRVLIVFSCLCGFFVSGKAQQKPSIKQLQVGAQTTARKPQNKHWRKKFRPRERTVPIFQDSFQYVKKNYIKQK